MDNQLPQQPQPKADRPLDEVQQPTEHLIAHSSGMPKIVLIIISVFVLLFVGVGGYMLGIKQTQPTKIGTVFPSVTQPSPTIATAPEWKMYTNEKYGFRMQYPASYSFTSFGPNIFQKEIDSGKQISGTVAPSYDTIIFKGDKQDFSIGIFHVTNENFSGYDGSCGSQFADKTLQDIKITTPFPYTDREQQVGNATTIQYCFLSGTKNLLVLGMYDVSQNNVEKNKQFLNQILSTFKFTQ